MTANEQGLALLGYLKLFRPELKPNIVTKIKITTKSQIEKLQPELKLNKEQKADDYFFCPNNAKPNVSGSLFVLRLANAVNL